MNFTYEHEGFLGGEWLEPVRWADGWETWQVSNGRGRLCGHWTLDGYLDRYDRAGEWEIVPVSGKHYRILAARFAPHRTNAILLVDGVRFRGDYARDYSPILVLA
jgi:hypothetical protein